jgi:catechol 2,3-dioxygenase-like lactoylglutathione lyase family enzyme
LASVGVMIRVEGFDHLVLRCADVETTLAWYTDRLGLAPVRVAEWRDGASPFPSVRVSADTIIDLIPAGALEPGARLDHICLVVDGASVEEVVAADDLVVVDGPAPRYGARGVATSVYILDPDGLTVELRAY